MPVAFERATVEDAAVLVEVQRLSFKEEADRYGECPPYDETPADLVDLIATAFVFKIVVDGKCVGDIVVRRRDDDSYYLRTISVIPAFRDRGIGSCAMAFLEAEFPDAAAWHLITPAGSSRNHHFYEKHGYHQVSQIYRSPQLTLIEYEKH
ncbi:MAG: GNAT family N-acetyltransferase [Candidatus Limnocylindrales bacterium]|jgi:GNAT superfamily N-acetyltransferase